MSDDEVLTCTASSEAVADMQRLLLTLYWGACASCGVDASGRPLPPEQLGTCQELRQAGHIWSHHITEGYWATFVPAAYVMITVTTGKVPFITLGGLFLEAQAMSGDEFVWLPWLLRFLDALVYVYLPVITAMVHRLCTGRRVYARFTTRTLLVTECTVNYKLLRAYVSKLMALSWRFATLTVVGQNGTDHLVHEFTHKAQSDVLMAVGLPDGRLHASAAAEACTLMSVQQAKFIKRAGKGVEVCSLGHNRWTRPGLCSRALALPTRRPIFAGEQLLLRDRISAQEVGNHCLAPGAVLQRWSDLLTWQLDPMGAPGMYVGAAKEVRELVGLAENIDVNTALRLLEMFLERQRKEAHEETVFLALDKFLEKYLAQHPSRIAVFVHSPEKGYKSPHKWYEQRADEDALRARSKGSDEKVYERSQGSNENLYERSVALAIQGPACGSRARIRTSFSEQLMAQLQNHECVQPATSAMDSQQVLALDEFLALLHSDELQNWVRSIKYRWRMIYRIRGLLSHFADEHVGKQDARVVLVNGASLSRLLLAWQQLAGGSAGQRRTNQEVDGLVSDVRDGERRHSIHEDLKDTESGLRTRMLYLDANSLMVGQDLLGNGYKGAEVLEGTRAVELFHEARVGSAERLIAWFVLFHSMAEPSSRLPFLTYELGKSESRLRVASTPAPVPVHSGSLTAEVHGVGTSGEEHQHPCTSLDSDCLCDLDGCSI
mmetsp:Transcript_116338/g.329097  ORF Transcript_116338/g.329097 Transcript_116338/m.329097 type:complete len:718 (-) Transcript_116338:166-2319(-)